MQVVGHVLRARYAYLRERHADALPEFLERLQPASRAVFEPGPLETTWYPIELLYDVVETADEMFGDGDLKLAEEMGAFAASRNLTGPLRGMVFKFGSPRFGLKFAPRAWSAMFQGGDIAVSKMESNHAELVLSRISGGARPSFVAGTKGWLLKAVELFGAEVTGYEVQWDVPEPGQVTFTCDWR